jgi:hypothetical protein
MALISPGVQVTVSDESQYTPTAAGSVAYVLLATAQDKRTPTGALATATTKANAEKIVRITSQRDLVLNYGNIEFNVDTSDNPIHGDERNEYGLLAAYSALGVASSLYVQRADLDLAQIEGTGIRPTGTPSDNTYWFDVGTSSTNFGIYSWEDDNNSFALKSPIVITDTAQLSGGAPISSIGAIGEYAVVTTSTSNPVYYKNANNNWVLVGSAGWTYSVPTIIGFESSPANLQISDTMLINTLNVSISGTTVADVVSAINTRGIPGVRADIKSTGELRIYAAANAKSNGSTVDGKLRITTGITIGGNDLAVKLGLLQANIATVSSGGNVYLYNGPTVQFSDYRNVPAWRDSDTTPRPSESVWVKTSATGNGANWGVKKYSSALQEWQLQTAPLYAGDAAAIYGLDPLGGGGNIPTGSLYVRYDTLEASTATFKIYRKNSVGVLKITGTTPDTPFVLTPGDAFTIEASVPGSDVSATATVTLGANVTTATGFVSAVLAANVPNIVAAVESSGAVSISHLAGGTIKLVQTAGTVIQDLGLDNDNKVQVIVANTSYLASPWTALTYTYSTTAPYSDPADGTYWYYNNALEVDIMIHDGFGWKGYQNGGVDARGYDLGNTDPLGPILSASAPTLQQGGAQIVAGDLWIDTGDLENYPMIYRYDGLTWVLIDNTDQISTDGILFTDARWAPNGTTDPIVDDIPAIADLLASNYIDDDCPDYRLYARGTLLFNTRRSGYNVKRFESQWFADPDTFSGTVTPTVVSAWVSSSGNDSDGVPYFGHKAQRNMVVEAMKSAIESSTALREDQVEFNLMVCPGYPELIQNMITLNNDRKQTSFIIGDSPLDLQPNGVETWGKNTALALNNGSDGLVSFSEYLGVYYPSGLATDLAGEQVVVPPSHMMLRTMIRSDNVSFPWFAPAGVRRGIIDNASSIGYIDVNDGNLFKSIGVTAGLRDTLYGDLVKINPLTVLPGVGLVAYGQKTRASQTSAMDRINVARLICYLRLVLDKVARPFLFEPNDTITRNQVKSAFEAVLNDLVAKRGLYDYLVVCDTSNNTPDRIDRNELYVDIAIKPVKAIEFIYIPVRIVNTGAPLTVV